MGRHVIAKFGGTSVKTAHALQQVARIVKHVCPSVIVLSAIGGVTDLLTQFCHSPVEERKIFITKVAQIHLQLTETLELSLKEAITHLMDRVYRIATCPLLSAQQKDEVLSCGEDIASLILCTFLKEKHGLSALSIDAREIIITDSNFGKARPDLSMIRERTRQWPRHELCIIQGFIGATKEGKTTTLGRGGSDYSAALLAEALETDKLLIYTDVPGVHTMDPNILPTAQIIKELGFQEMAEMANFGAKILHPATLEPCMRSNIPTHILSTFDENQPGTCVRTIDDKDQVPFVRGIATRRKQVLLTIRSLQMVDRHGFLVRIFTILAKHKISIDLITTSEASIALSIDGTYDHLHAQHPIRHNTALYSELSALAEVVIKEQLTLVAIVGRNLSTAGVMQKILGVVKDQNIRLICYGASNRSISMLVPEKEDLQVVEKLHSRLLEEVNFLPFMNSMMI